MDLTGSQIADLLGLQPHPTCGIVAESYRSPLQLPANALPAAYGGSRPLGNVLNFMVTSTARVHLHRIRSDQMYHHHIGMTHHDSCWTIPRQT